MAKSKGEQKELFQVHNTFFVFLNALALDGTLARLQKKCSASLAVLVCLKCSADFQTGLVSKGTTLLAKQAGCSRASVHKAIDALAAEGLVEIQPRENGKRAIYRLFDKATVRKDGEEAGEIRFPFTPNHMGHRLQDLAAFRTDGELPARALAAGMNVTINLNITNIGHAENVYVATEEMEGNLRALADVPAGPWKEAALRALKLQVARLEAENSGTNEDNSENSVPGLPHILGPSKTLPN